MGSLEDTPDKTFECFAKLDFCKPGQKPEYTPGKECPSCWPAENKACMCFAALGFCDASATVLSPANASATVLSPAPLPTHSRCQQLCPDCKDTKCKCDGCWPGSGLADTPDTTCNCFAQLGFCAPGEEPVYTPGKECPSCWPAENRACDCFAALGFCEARPTA